jgi:lincosamide nucleotidyltransferase A/C/D/E
MFDAPLVHAVLDAVLDAVPDAVIDGGWGIDALVGRQTREHDDLDLVIASTGADAAVAALVPLGFADLTDERPTRLVVSRSDGCHVDLHLVEHASTGTTQHLPGDRRFTYFLDDTSGVIDGRSVRCLSPEMQLLTHAGYEPDDDDRADVALVADVSGLAVPPPYASPLPEDETVLVREATVADVPATCIVRMRSWRAAYAGLMPQPIIDAFDIGTMWSAWRASVHRPPSRSMRLFVTGPPGEVHSYALVRPGEGSDVAGEVAALYSDPTAWGSTAGWATFNTAVDYLRTMGRTELSLWMLKGNERARRFYERAGWQPSGEEQTETTAGGSYVEVRYRLVES